MAESSTKDASRVKIDGEEAVLHITDQSVMFEKGGRVSGFLRSAIQMVKPDGDSMVIAYSAGSEVKSVRVEPMTAAATLLVPSSATQEQPPMAGLDEDFERLYHDTRKELEERLAKVQANPEDKSRRLTPEEEMRYSKVSREMEKIIGVRFGLNPQEEGNPISFWGLEKQPYDLQVKVVETLHILLLRILTSPRAEASDVAFSGAEVWPEDWERILVKFNLSEGPFLSDEFKKHLESHWTIRPGKRKPVLAYP